MKVTYLAPGTGGTFYCQNCMRDTALVRALRRHGHDLTMAPVYLPILIDDGEVTGDVPVFFGGVNVYLQQKMKLFRKTPRWLDKIFDASWMLRMAAQFEGSTEAAGLGPMTLSMLQGPQGRQRKELDRLLDWLVEHEKPDVVHISNSLLIGLAGELKRRLDVSVVCTLQDEENWLDEIDEPYDRMCWDAMSEKSADIDAFVAVSDWYGREMSSRMKLNGAQLHVVPLGIEPDPREPVSLDFEAPVIGYLSKMCESLGLGVLVDAFIELKRLPEFANLKLRATGGQHGPDTAFVKGLRRKLEDAGFGGDVEFLEGFDLAQRREFIRSLTLLSVPAKQGEAFGMYIIESLTEGVPVVQPRAGGYPEVVEATGGGVLYDPEDPKGLVDALRELLLDPERARKLGRDGREAVLRDFGVDRMAEGIARVYETIT